jgi:predicted ATPase
MLLGAAESWTSWSVAFAKSETGERVIDIVGEPGIGKSRLLHEFRKFLPSAKAFVLSGNCSLHGQQIPFLPFIEVARGSFRLEVGEDEAEAARKLDKGLNLLGLASDENLGLLLNLLGLRIPEGALEELDGVLIGLRTRDLLLRLLKERCRTSRVVMFVEDLHWMDGASAELLGRVIAEDISRLLLVHTRRPEYLPPWRDQQRVTTLTLQPLAAAETSEIIRSRFPVLDAPLARLIADRAEGNPLFAEEIVGYLLDRGVVRQTPDGIQYEAAEVSAALPGSIQALLTARIDCLAADDRTLLQAAAVIGRRFRVGLLAVVTDSRDVEARLRSRSYRGGRASRPALRLFFAIVSVLQTDSSGQPSANYRCSRSYTFSRRPFSRASRPFIGRSGTTAKGRFGASARLSGNARSLRTAVADRVAANDRFSPTPRKDADWVFDLGARLPPPTG